MDIIQLLEVMVGLYLKKIDINYIVDELKKGKSIKELSCEFNVSRETIKRSLIRYEYKIKDIQNRKIVNSNAQKKINLLMK